VDKVIAIFEEKFINFKNKISEMDALFGYKVDLFETEDNR
jgi:hypothetical protein